VPALEVAGDLDLVDRQERGVDLVRQCLDRADAEARRSGDDLLFPVISATWSAPMRWTTRL